MARSLDNLIGRSVTPLVVAFVPRKGFSEFGSRSAKYSQALAEELIPLIDKDFRTRAGSEARGAMGAGDGGRIALYTALRRSSPFTRPFTLRPHRPRGRARRR